MTDIVPTRRFGRTFTPGVLLALLPGLLRTYLLMPFPGSQDLEAVKLAYLLEITLPFTRAAGALLALYGAVSVFRHGGTARRIVTALVLAASAFGVHFVDMNFSAENIFREPGVKTFSGMEGNAVDPERLVIGVERNGTAKAYPINYLGYHHKVQDTVGGLPVLVTYCTMCRTARVYSPVINGRHEEFRLVGARHYNAVVEDGTTRTWWYQATGQAAAGPLYGRRLDELPYEQVTLGAWAARHPRTLVLQPDTSFAADYEELARYDRTPRVPPDASGAAPPWQRKSWVLGIDMGGNARAYDWDSIRERRVLNDRIGSMPVVIAVEGDLISFHVWSRATGSGTREFAVDSATGLLRDLSTSTLWNWDGEFTPADSTQMQTAPPRLTQPNLMPVLAYQEYWHSWQRFHPATTQWP